MKIKNRTEYRIKGKSPYFKDKYGTSNPICWVEDEADKVFDRSWGMMNGNPTAMLFGIRAGLENLPAMKEKVYYVKVKQPAKKKGDIEPYLAELVCESELEEIK